MALDTFMLIASSYDDEADAVADFDAVRAAYLELGLIDTYDAAVVSKHADGDVKIVKHVEEPTRHRGAAGLGHVARGISQTDLKDLGELLDDGQSGLVVIAASDVEGRVTDATSRAKRQAKKQLQAVTDELAEVIEQL